MSRTLLRVQRWADEGYAIKRLLEADGPAIMARLCERMSLRKVAKRTKLSPTYLSRVATRQIVVSPGAYVKLGQLETRIGKVKLLGEAVT